MQSFRPQWRYHEDRRFITIFIACTVCPWRQDLRLSTVEIEQVRYRIGRHHALAARQVRQFGDVQAHTQQALGKLRTKLGQLERQLQGNNEPD